MLISQYKLMLLSSIAYVLYFVPDLSREWFKLHQTGQKNQKLLCLNYYFDLLLAPGRQNVRAACPIECAEIQVFSSTVLKVLRI